MIWSKSLVPTLREDPRQAENLSHRLLLRAGFIRPVGSGLYNLLPFGVKVTGKVTGIIREEMNRIGGQEMTLTALSPRSLWEESGRWEAYGEDMFRLRDRKGQDLALCPTHEEVMAQIAAKELRSYKQLPQIWYQFQTKYRDEPRPRGGILRTRQFVMKDSYSFDLDEAGLDRSFNQHHKAYSRSFARMGHRFFVVRASGGIMGTGDSAEFMVEAESGEDVCLVCPNCSYRANAEVAEGQPKPAPELSAKKEKIHTPEKKSVAEVSAFLAVQPGQLVKSLLFIREGKPLLLLLRGDQELSEAKLKRVFGEDMIPATEEDAHRYMGASLGFLGPQGVDVETYADKSLEGADLYAAGANQDDYHLLGVSLSADVNISGYLDLRVVKAGDLCPECSEELKEKRTIELGHIFKLGTKYSRSLGASVLDEEGNDRPVVMGSYGIGIERSMAALVDQYYKDERMSWPVTVAPFEAQVISLGEDDVAGRLYEQLMGIGVDVALDDRDITPGVKFADADLVGIPYQIVVGPRSLAKGEVELKLTGSNRTLNVALDDAAAKACELIAKEKKDACPQ